MKNRVLVISGVFLLLITLFAFAYNTVTGTDPWAGLTIYIPLNIVNIIGIYLLVTNGTILTTRYWRAMQLAVSIVFLGAILKIQHWAGANPLLVTGLLSFPLIYISRFCNKLHKGLLDALKLTWIISFFGLKALAILHAIPSEIALVSMIILGIACAVFMMSEKKKVHEYDFDFLKDKKVP